MAEKWNLSISIVHNDQVLVSWVGYPFEFPKNIKAIKEKNILIIKRKKYKVIAIDNVFGYPIDNVADWTWQVEEFDED